MHEYIICCDSVIAVCWVSAEKKSLSMYHRNRVIQIRRSSELENIFHVKTDENLADLGTRPEKVKVSDVGLESEWECGKGWMHEDVSDAVEQGILRPVSDLRLNAEKDADDYRDGLVFGVDADIFCNAVTKTRVDQLQLRVDFSGYLLVPTKFGFRKVVRIMAIVLSFINKCRKKVLTSVNLLGSNEQFKFCTFQVGSSSLPPSEDAEDCYADQDYLFHHFRDRACNTDQYFAITQTDQTLHEMPQITVLAPGLGLPVPKGSHFNTKAKVDKVAWH